MNERFDAAIVGGGVAGSALAGLLASIGFGVLVVEKEQTFRDRVRGEGIHPWGVAEARRLGLAPTLVEAGANELPVWQTYTDRVPNPPFRWADVSVDGLPEIAVSHPSLQESLLTWARDRGAEVIRPGKVTALRSGPEIAINEEGKTREVRARLVVGADGRTSAVRRWIGGAALRDRTHHRIGGGLFDGVELDASATHEASFPGGRLFAMPQGGGRARIYYVASDARLDRSGAARSPSDFLAACVPHFPSGPLDQAIVAGPAAFFSNADTWSSRIAAAGAVLIGDAAGANDPSVGHGLSIAFRDVRILGELMQERRDWSNVPDMFAQCRHAYYQTLRAHAAWVGALTTEEGRDADARRERVGRARELDPTAGGFALIYARGPDGLVADETARRRFFGEDLA